MYFYKQLSGIMDVANQKWVSNPCLFPKKPDTITIRNTPFVVSPTNNHLVICCLIISYKTENATCVEYKQ